jgi:hypothetical protein
VLAGAVVDAFVGVGDGGTLGSAANAPQEKPIVVSISAFSLDMALPAVL